MPDLRQRFRSLDRLPAPDLWSEVADRAQAPQRTNWPFALGAAAVVVLLAVLVGLQLRSGAPVGGPAATESASPATSAEPNPSSDSSASAAPSAPVEPAPSDGLPAFTCDLPVSLVAAGSDFHPLVTQDIRLGTHDGYDRIVFEYDGGTPSLEMDAAEPPFVRDPSGLPLEVSGSVVYRITLTGATKYDQETGEQPYQGPTDFEPGYTQIVQFVESGDFEATHSWYLGVNSNTCVRVFALTDPSRIVIDVQH
ncbi:MAG: AMIN-like domain-containing (lipo)protein [Candidatus Limnocylindria bacterium]